MTAALWCRFLLGGVILGGVHGIEGPAGAFLVERCFILHIDDGGSRRRGAVETRCPMRGDGLAQVEVVVWRQGGVDDGVTSQGRSLNICSEDGPVEDGGDDTCECVRPVYAPDPVCGSAGASGF